MNTIHENVTYITTIVLVALLIAAFLVPSELIKFVSTIALPIVLVVFAVAVLAIPDETPAPELDQEEAGYEH